MDPFCNPRRAIQTPRASQGWGLPGGVCQLCSHSSFFLTLPLPRVLPQGGEAEPTSHPQFQEPGGLRQSWGSVREGTENGATEVLVNRPLGVNQSETTLNDWCFYIYV